MSLQHIFCSEVYQPLAQALWISVNYKLMSSLLIVQMLVLPVPADEVNNLQVIDLNKKNTFIFSLK